MDSENTQDTQPEGFAAVPVVSTVEEIIEAITNTQTPAASAEVLLGWIIHRLEGATSLGDVQSHLADLKANKDALAQAVAS